MNPPILIPYLFVEFDDKFHIYPVSFYYILSQSIKLDLNFYNQNIFKMVLNERN